MSFSIGCWEFYRHQHTDWIQFIIGITADIAIDTASITTTIGRATAGALQIGMATVGAAQIGIATAVATASYSTIGIAVLFKKNTQSPQQNKSKRRRQKKHLNSAIALLAITPIIPIPMNHSLTHTVVYVLHTRTTGILVCKHRTIRFDSAHCILGNAILAAQSKEMFRCICCTLCQRAWTK